MKESMIVRNAEGKDIPIVTKLIYAVCEAEGDVSLAVTEEDLQNEWEYEGFDPEKDVFIVETQEGQTAGYAALFDIGEHSELSCDIYLHPECDKQQTADLLLNAVKKRAGEHAVLAPQDANVRIETALDNRNKDIKQIFINADFVPIRYHWRMEASFTKEPSLPELPDGFEIRPFNPDEQTEAVWKARNEAFLDKPGNIQLTFEQFTHYLLEIPEYDPSLWKIIWKEDQIAGFSINHNRMEIGWVRMLGVSPKFRRKGLAKILLQHSFAEFFKRSRNTIGLVVESDNDTGAIDLYQNAGMYLVSEFVSMEKIIRLKK